MTKKEIRAKLEAAIAKAFAGLQISKPSSKLRKSISKAASKLTRATLKELKRNQLKKSTAKKVVKKPKSKASK